MQLQDPLCALTMKFAASGAVSIDACVLTKGKYVLTELYPATVEATGVKFEFKVNVGKDPLAPRSAVLIERFDEWGGVWDDEVAHALGGKSFPFGTDPLPATGLGNPVIHPKDTISGEFILPSPPPAPAPAPVPPDPWRVSLKSIKAPYKTISTSDIEPGTPLKYLSLWLPGGTDGHIKLFKMDGTVLFEITANATIGGVASGNLKAVTTFVKKNVHLTK